MDLPARTKEVEAESVAFTVCSYFGIDTSDYTFPYVAGWSGETETKALKESLDTIRDTSSMLIHEIEDSFREIKRDMEVSGLAEDILDLQRGDDASVNVRDADGAALSSVIRQLRDGRAQTVISVLRERYRNETDPDKKEKISSLMRRAEALRKDMAQTDRERKEMER